MPLTGFVSVEPPQSRVELMSQSLSVPVDVLIALEAADFEVRVEALRIRAADLCV